MIGYDRGQTDYDPSTEGRVPGLTYSGGLRPWHIPPGCPPVLTAECLEVGSRWFEQTFRNFQGHCRRPSHADPPFTGRPIDRFVCNTAPVGTYGDPGAFVTTATFTMPVSSHRGVICYAGQAVEDPAAFNFLDWRITVDGIPHPEYTSIRLQIWDFVPPTPLLTAILLNARQTVALEIRNFSQTVPFVGCGRLVGWFYPTRSEIGERIGSTIVD